MPYDLIFFLIPIASVVAFGTCLYRYLYARHRNKTDPECFSERELGYRLSGLVITSVILFVVAVCFVGLIALLYLAVAYM